MPIKLYWEQTGTELSPAHKVDNFLPGATKPLLEIKYHYADSHWCITVLGMKTFWRDNGMSEAIAVKEDAEIILSSFANTVLQLCK